MNYKKTHIDKKVNLESMTSVTVDYLVPNKDYEFNVVLKTKNSINDSSTGSSGEDAGEGEDNSNLAVTLPEHGDQLFYQSMEEIP